MLLMASEHDPLFLQVQGGAPFGARSRTRARARYANHGQRVVHRLPADAIGQRSLPRLDRGPSGRHFYIRQLKDMKIKPMVEVFTPSVMLQYAELCGWTLAHAHARSGEPAKISGYLGKSDKFDEAIADF